MNKQELINLQANFVQFMHHTKFLHMDRSATDPTLGRVKYEMDVVTMPHTTTIPNNSNVRAFMSEIVVRGFDIEAFSGVNAGETGGVPNQAVISRGAINETTNFNGETQLDPDDTRGPSP